MIQLANQDHLCHTEQNLSPTPAPKIRRPRALRDGHSNKGATIRFLMRRRRDLLTEMVTRHAHHLKQEDSALLDAVVIREARIDVVAQLLNDNIDRCRRRVRRLLQRLSSFEFGYVANRMATWSEREQSVARTCFLRGLTIKQAALELGISASTTRRTRERIAARIEGAREPRKGGRR